MATCTYTFKGADGKSTAIQGIPALKAFLLTGGLDTYLPNRAAEMAGPAASRREQKNETASRVEGTSADRFKRTEQLQQAVADLQEGKITSDEYNRMVDDLRPVFPYKEVPAVTAPKDARYALSNGRGQSPEKAAKYGQPSMTLIKGDWAQLRLDIPSYQEHDAWVVSVHTPKSTNREVQAAYDAGPVVGYESVAALTDVTFGMNQKAAAKIATGSAKGTIATMLGKWSPISKADAKARAEEAMKDPAWTQVGMDPFRHSYFYDRDSMRPVLSADEVIQIGPLVLAKNVKFGTDTDITGAPIAFSTKQDINAKLEQKILSDFDGAVKEYSGIDGTKNGRLLDTDLARQLSPEYRADRTLAPQVHEASSAFTQALFEKRMDEMRSRPGGLVLFMAGGGGAGKSSAETLLADSFDRANTIVDGTLSGYDKAKRNVQLALDSGQAVMIAYVYREPVDALKYGVFKRAMDPKNGRTVALDALVKGHAGSNEVVRKLQKDFASNDLFQIMAVDNSKGLGNFEIVPLEDIPVVSNEGLKEKLQNATDEEYKNGRINKAVYESTTRGFNARPEGRGQGQATGNQPRTRGESQAGNEPSGPVDEVAASAKQLASDPALERWAQSIFNGRGNITESKILADKLPHPSLAMGPVSAFGENQKLVLDGHALDHAAKHVEDGITAQMIGQLPAALKDPRMVTFQGPGQALVMLPLRAATGAPIVVALKKEEIKGGGQVLKVTRFATTYPLDNSAAYLVREIRKGNRVWLPLEEVSRLRDLLGRLNATQGAGQDQRLTKTLALPLARGGNQAMKNFSVLSNDALDKKQNNEKGWEKTTETVAIPDNAEKQLADVAFSRRSVGKETEGWILSRDATGRFRFGAGAKAYRLVADVASTLLDKIGAAPVSPELSRALRKMKTEISKAQDLTVEVAKNLKELTEQERAMVSDVIEGELRAGIRPPKRVLEIAASMQAIMSEQSAELVRLGMLTPGAAGRWDGKYLPRFYESKIGDEAKAWMKAVKGLLGRQRVMQGITGNSLKARGMFENVPVADMQDWIAQGWEKRDDTFDPAVDDTVTMWRDYNRKERDDMGEIRDAMFRFVMGYNKSQRDLALGRLYENLAATQASRVEKPGYVKVPPSTIEDTAYVRRYGKLAGKWVPKEVMDQLSTFDSSMQNDLLKMYLKGLSMWKEGKTVLNPVSHANNVMSNLTMAHFAGVSYWDVHKYAGAVYDLVKGTSMVDEAKEAGLFVGTFNRTELLEQLPDQLKAMAQMTESKAGMAVDRTWNALSFFLRKPAGKAYEAEDLFFRYLIYRDARKNGMSVDDAVDWSQEFIFTYDDLPKGARMARDFALPFFSYTYKVVPVLARTLLEHPVRYAAPALALYTVNAYMYALAASLGGGADEDWWTVIRRYATDPEFRSRARGIEKQERENLPPWMKGASATLATPKAIRLGMDDVTNLPVFLDISRVFPGGDLLDASANAGGVPILQPITPSNPILNIVGAMVWNKDAFTGKDVVDNNDTSAEAAAKRGAWLWKQLTPAIAVGNYHWDRAMNVLANTTGNDVFGYTGIGKDGLPVQPGYAAMQTVGIKARPIDLELSEKISNSQRKKLITDLSSEIKRIDRLEQKGAITAKNAEAERELQKTKRERLREGLTVEGKEKD